MTSEILTTINFIVCITNIALLVYWTIKPTRDQRRDQKSDKHAKLQRLGAYTITCPLTTPMKHGTTEMTHHYTFFKNVETDSVYAIDSYDIQKQTEDGEKYYGQVLYYGISRHHELLIQVYDKRMNLIYQLANCSTTITAKKKRLLANSHKIPYSKNKNLVCVFTNCKKGG